MRSFLGSLLLLIAFGVAFYLVVSSDSEEISCASRGGTLTQSVPSSGHALYNVPGTDTFCAILAPGAP